MAFSEIIQDLRIKGPYF